MRLALFIVGVALAMLGGAIAWLCRESLFTFEPTPLVLPVAIAPAWHAEAPFAIQHTATYEIEFDCENPGDLRPPDYGAWDTSVESVRIHWEILAEGRRVAAGDSATYPKNSYGSGDRTGHEIGRFEAEAGRQYVLRVAVESGDASLNAHRPQVMIRLNGQELSDLSNVDEAREILHRYARNTAAGGLVLVGMAVVIEAWLRFRRRHAA